MEAPAASLANFLGAGRILIGNKSTPIGTLGVESEPSVKLLQFASVEKNKFYDVPGVLGHYFLFGQAPLISTGAPMRANFKEAGDAVIFCIKQSGTLTYLYGITIENLLLWEPPTKAGELIKEDGVLQSWKSTHSDILSLVALEDTETHKFKAIADKFMSHMPTFAMVKIKDSKGAHKWCAAPFTTNIRAVVDASEVEARKRGKDKSDAAADKTGAESIALGVEAKTFWSERKKMLLTAEPYYVDDFDERFVMIKLEEDGKVADTSELRRSLRCALSL